MSDITTDLKGYLAEKQMKPAEFNHLIGNARKDTRIYAWLSGKTKPSDEAIAQIRKAINGHASPAVSVKAPAKVSGDFVRIRLDVMLLRDQALPILRVLLDAGIIAQVDA